MPLRDAFWYGYSLCVGSLARVSSSLVLGFSSFCHWRAPRGVEHPSQTRPTTQAEEKGAQAGRKKAAGWSGRVGGCKERKDLASSCLRQLEKGVGPYLSWQGCPTLHPLQAEVKHVAGLGTVHPFYQLPAYSITNESPWDSTQASHLLHSTGRRQTQDSHSRKCQFGSA